MAEFTDINLAIDTEKQIKKWSRAKKEALINGDYDALPNLAKKKFKQRYFSSSSRYNFLFQKLAFLKQKITRSDDRVKQFVQWFTAIYIQGSWFTHTSSLAGRHFEYFL